MYLGQQLTPEVLAKASFNSRCTLQYQQKSKLFNNQTGRGFDVSQICGTSKPWGKL